MTESSATMPASGMNEDILFECPFCTKSLQIDARGAGLMIECPDCHQQVQVPEFSSVVPAGVGGQQVGIKLEEIIDQLNARIRKMEKASQADENCIKRIGDEIVLIQAALDRITEIVESRKV